MKTKNKIRPGILTALLAVLSLQGVEFKKKIGLITAIAVLVSLTGIAAANPFNINIIQPGGNPTTFSVGQTNTFGLDMGNFLAPSPASATRTIEVAFSNIRCNTENPYPYNDTCNFANFELVRGLQLIGDGPHGGALITIPSNQATAIYLPSSKDARGTFDIKLKGPLTDPVGTRYSMSIFGWDISTGEDVQSATITVQFVLPPPPPPPPQGEEYWNVEWFNTMPWQFTEFVLPFGQDYMVTSGFRAPEAVTHIFDGVPTPLAVNNGDRLKFWHNSEISDDLYVNEIEVNGGSTETMTVQSTLKLYGYFDKGPGDLTAIDPVTNKKPEQAPYTDPISPFYPQARDSPRKDFVTFNPAIMDHNQGWPELIFLDPNAGSNFGNNIQRPQEKTFKRMWYEKAWFKDDYQAKANGRWDVVIEACKPLDEAYECSYVTTLPLDDEEAIHNQLMAGNRIREHNNDPNFGDTYAPAIEQEFAYMTLNDIRMPIMVKNGSHILIPMAHQANNPYRGINSFDAANHGVKDAVRVESEKTLGMDIDGDGQLSMDTDGKDVSGDESIVLVLDNKKLSKYDNLQFFDNVVTLKDIFTNPASIVYKVCDNEGGGSQNCVDNQVLAVGEVAKFQRGMVNSKGPFYIKLIGVDTGSNKAIIEVGRMFGQTRANIGDNARWNQKSFIVDEVFYNIVGIKTRVVDGVEQFKYIVIRQKLPKDEIKLYGKHLKVWGTNEVLPELPPFNTPHEIIVDVSEEQDKVKIGNKIEVPPLEIRYIREAKEKRFVGELKEIYNQSGNKEAWVVEWFNTMPFQYTEFVLPFGQKYLVTTGFRAPEAATHIWDGNATGEELPVINHGDRLKFWHDASIGTGLYINGYRSIEESTLRLYGYFDEGPGDLNVIDPATSKKPEQAPYTDPEAPFYPQSSQSPRKDFVTFNPAIMDHNQGWPELIFLDPANGNTIQRPQEKTFKRMWYEKAWFKDDYQVKANGRWDVVIESCKPLDPSYECQYVTTLPLDDEEAIHDHLAMGHRIREHNNDPALGDTYAPAIEQEFAYMTLNDIRMPIMVQSGSHILIPMAHYDDTYRGINSFDAADMGVKDAVKVESEKTLGMDIDGDGQQSTMDPDGTVMGDESIVLVLDNKKLSKYDNLQFFDNVVTLKDVFTNPASIVYKVCDNEGGGSQNCIDNQVLNIGQVAKYQRGMINSKGPFYIKLIAVDTYSNKAVIEVGRMFGQTRANIGDNTRWNQKAFIVDEVFYNVVAIKTKVVNGVEQFKYIVIRQKLPKDEIKLYGKHLKVWSPGEILPELPPFNMPHEIIVDVLRNQAKPANMQDKIGQKIPVDALEIIYVLEAKEPRFQGQLKEIYNQTGVTQPDQGTQPGACTLPNGKTVDLTGDGIVDIDDASKLILKWGTNDSAADLTGDGIVDIDDASKLILNWGKVC